jgi:hypothetical protein
LMQVMNRRSHVFDHHSIQGMVQEIGKVCNACLASCFITSSPCGMGHEMRAKRQPHVNMVVQLLGFAFVERRAEPYPRLERHHLTVFHRRGKMWT